MNKEKLKEAGELLSRIRKKKKWLYLIIKKTKTEIIISLKSQDSDFFTDEHFALFCFICKHFGVHFAISGLENPIKIHIF